MILCSVQLLQYVRNSWNVCYNKSLSTFLIKLRCKMGRSCVRISYWNNTLLEKKDSYWKKPHRYTVECL